MDKPFLPLSRPCIGEQEIRAVGEVLRSGWITTGPKGAELEQRFRDVTGCRNAVALSSATAGMHLLLHALEIGPGDEVITPSMTWVSTANLIALRGATPVFVDVDRDSLMVTAEHVAPFITERSRLIVPVHFAGAVLDIEPLRELARAREIPLVEDAAHALGSRYGDEWVGARGTAIFSFHPLKNITTGEGGMVCTQDEELARRIRRLRFHGLEVDAHERLTRARGAQAQVLEPGYKYNLPDMNAVLGLGQLDKLEAMNARRAELASLYLELLAPLEEILPLAPARAHTHHAWHLFIVRLDIEAARISRDAFQAALQERGIGTGLHFRAVHTHEFYRDRARWSGGPLENTEWNSERLLSLPLFPDMREQDVERVVSAIRAILREARA